MSDPVAGSAAARTPQGTLTLQTVPMPADTNSGGDVFGGWVVSQMDIAAGTTAMDRAQGRCDTVAIEALRTAWDQRAVTMDDLWSAAQTVRMSNVMRPYLESLT